MYRVYTLASTGRSLNTVEHIPLFLLNVGCGLHFVLIDIILHEMQAIRGYWKDRVNSCFH